MAQVLVRNLDQQVVTALRRKAELRVVLAAAARLSNDERVPLARCVRDMTPAAVKQTDSAELIRRDRDTR
jgi:hypothetical protein